MTTAELLAALDQAIAEAPPEELPAIAGRVRAAELLAELRLRSAPAPSRSGDGVNERNLSAREAAGRLGISAAWLYKTKLPFKVKIGRRVVFSARGLERWSQERQRRY